MKIRMAHSLSKAHTLLVGGDYLLGTPFVIIVWSLLLELPQEAPAYFLLSGGAWGLGRVYHRSVSDRLRWRVFFLRNNQRRRLFHHAILLLGRQDGVARLDRLE